MADTVSFSTSRNTNPEDVSQTSDQAAEVASSAGGGNSSTGTEGDVVDVSTSRNAGAAPSDTSASSAAETSSSSTAPNSSSDAAQGPVNISTSRNESTGQPASSTSEDVSDNTQTSSTDTQASAGTNNIAQDADSSGLVNISTSRNESTGQPASSTSEDVSDNTQTSSTDTQNAADADQDSDTETINVSTSRNSTGTSSSDTTSTELSTASDTIGADSEGLEKLLTGLTQFCENLAQAIDKFMPEASDERFQELENGALKDTGITAQNIIDTAHGVSTFLHGLAEISDEAVNDLDSIDVPATQTSSANDNISVNLDDVVDPDDDADTDSVADDSETDSTTDDSETDSTTSTQDTGTHTAEATSAEETTQPNTQTNFSTSRNNAAEASETTNLNTPTGHATAQQATEGQHLSNDSSTHTSSTQDTPLKAQAAAETTLSAESGTPANHVPDSSPVATSGPTKSASDVINTPDSGPARDVLRSNAPAIKETYPDVPISDAKQKQIAAELMGQNSGNGSKQPVDTIHLTDQQVRTLAEAIAHNINLRRQAAAEQMMSQIDMGGVDSFGGGGAGFEAGELSNDYQQAVVELAEQIVNTQPPIPYAWGGGTLEGPSQGISDGGGYADACGDYNKIGFDCSGLVRYMFYQLTGVELPRVSQAQYEYCQPVTDPMPGDIGFPGGGAPGHVFMYVGNGEIIEAQQSGTVMMFSPADASYVWGRPPESPNWDV